MLALKTERLSRKTPALSLAAFEKEKGRETIGMKLKNFLVSVISPKSQMTYEEWRRLEFRNEYQSQKYYYVDTKF